MTAAAAAAITAEFGRSAPRGSTTEEDILSPMSVSHHHHHHHHRGRPSADSRQMTTSMINGRHRSTPRNVGRLGGNASEPSLGHCNSNSSLTKARREFFQISDEKADPRRIKASETNSSGYASNGSGDSDLANCWRAHGGAGGRVASSCPESPEARGSNGKYGGSGGGTAFSSPSSSSSANSLTFSSGASLGGVGFNDLRSTYTEEILKVLEEDGLVLQTCPRDNLSPLPTSVSERRASADYNVIELSRQYRKKELSQLRGGGGGGGTSGDKFQLITDAYRLQQLLESTDDEDRRRVIRQRLLELKSGIRNKENGAPRLRSLSTREMETRHHSTGDERKYSSFGSPIKDPNMVGGIAALTLPSFHGSCGSSPSSPAANGHKSLTPTGPTTKIIARTPAEIKTALLRWCQIKTRGYSNVFITNFTKSWADGLAFCALIHHFFPNSFDYSKLENTNRRENFELSFRIAEEMAGIVPLLDVDDMISMGDNPEYKCIYTYVQSMYRNLHTLDQGI